jgi:hypothetical protein
MIAQPMQDLTTKLEQLQLNVTPTPSVRLSHLMDNVRAGSEEVIRTPFLKNLAPEDILGKYTLDVFEKNVKLLNSKLAEIEAEQQLKFGPRSIQKPWTERKDALLASFNIASKDVALNKSFSDTFSGQGRLRMCSELTSLKAMKRTTSAGLPCMVRKSDVLDGIVNYNPGNDKEFWPTVLFTRTQEGGKTRDVLGYPMNILLLEGSVFLPFFNIFRENPMVSALGGPDAVDIAIDRLVKSIKGDEYVLSEDFSTFDQTVGTDLQAIAFQCIRTWFQGSSETTASIQAIEDAFANIGIATPDGVYNGSHGIPSGSWFTNVVGSLVHAYAQSTIKDLDPVKCQVMGDDGVLVIPKSITKEAVENQYGTLGLSFNANKTFESENEVIYLQRYYSRDYEYDGQLRGIYPVYRALNRLIHMERWTNIQALNGKDYFAIRAICILENCKWHPMHREFVKWVYENDKYSLEFSHNSLNQFIANFANKTTTGIKNQYSDYVEGIESFETVKILKTF